MNLVLHRSQVALNVNQFDITGQVAEQLNKVLASVVIPPDGVSPATLAQGAGQGDARRRPGLGSGLGSGSGQAKPAPAPKPARREIAAP